MTTCYSQLTFPLPLSLGQLSSWYLSVRELGRVQHTNYWKGQIFSMCKIFNYQLRYCSKSSMKKSLKNSSKFISQPPGCVNFYSNKIWQEYRNTSANILHNRADQKLLLSRFYKSAASESLFLICNCCSQFNSVHRFCKKRKLNSYQFLSC